MKKGIFFIYRIFCFLRSIIPTKPQIRPFLRMHHHFSLQLASMRQPILHTQRKFYAIFIQIFTKQYGNKSIRFKLLPPLQETIGFCEKKKLELFFEWSARGVQKLSMSATLHWSFFRSTCFIFS